ncbi:receptor-transporting protein 4 [Perognathus longimembris pacificus]|uniref:receptor-transporting protein 4 n=1 Tax=Perognathus longimembris pacificus TaxID=214514 RepID=UPI002018F62E|nr:receptor-transporting protein 4 [Perognathus longimembris pacificus]
MLALDAHKWEQKFQERMQQEIPWVKWTLKLDKNITPDFLPQGWMQYQQRAFGRFLCARCNRSWMSAQINILCHIYWDPWKSEGQVLMRTFAQKCQNCSSSRFENPEFSIKNIRRILKNLVQYILHVYYGHGFEEIVVIYEEPLDRPSRRRINIVGCGVRCSSRQKRKSSKSLPSPQESSSSLPPLDDSLIPEPQGNLTLGQMFMLIFITVCALILGQILNL